MKKYITENIKQGYLRLLLVLSFPLGVGLGIITILIVDDPDLLVLQIVIYPICGYLLFWSFVALGVWIKKGFQFRYLTKSIIY